MTLQERIQNAKNYSQLVAAVEPRIPRNKRALANQYRAIEALMGMEKPKAWHLECLETLSALVEAHESQSHPTPEVAPNKMLKHLIEARNVSKSEVARATGIPRSTITQLTSGERTVGVGHIKKLAEYFEVSPEVFLGSYEA